VKDFVAEDGQVIVDERHHRAGEVSPILVGHTPVMG
jgi:hypothetical protein